MNEQDNNISSNQQPINNTINQGGSPNPPEQAQESNTPITHQPIEQSQSISQETIGIQPEFSNQQPVTNEVQQEPFNNQNLSQEVAQVTPQPQVVQPTEPILNTPSAQPEITPQQPQQVNQEENSAQQHSVPSEADVTQNEVHQDILPEQPANNTQQSDNVYGPSVPLVGVEDATNSGFVATDLKPPKKKKTGLIVTIVVVLLIALGLIGYFVIYPTIKNKYLDKPENVYQTTIKSLFNGISNVSNEILHTKAIYDVDLALESNMETLKDFNGYNFQINLGLDPANKRLQEGINIKNNNVENSYYYYVKNNKIYEKISTYKDNAYIYLGEATEDVNSIFDKLNNEDLLNTSNNLSSEDLNYLIEKLSNALINSIDSSKLTKEDTSIDINKETLKVINNKYVVNTDTYVNMVNSIIDEFINDDKALEILAKYNGTSKDEFKKALDKAKITDSENLDVNFTTNIYTYGKNNDIVGIAIVDDKDDFNFHCYFKDEYFEVNLVTKTDNEITGKKDTNTLELVGSKDGRITNVTLTYNNKKILTLKIKEWSDNLIDFDYEIAIENNVLSGSFKLNRDINDSRAKYNIDLTLKAGDEYITLKLNLNVDWTSEVANINTDAAVTLDDNELTMQRNTFMKAILDTPLGKLFSTVSGDYDDNIPDYYDDENGSNLTQGENSNNQVQNPNENTVNAA